MERGGIAVAFATVTPGFLVADVGENFQPQSAIYHTQEEAERQALSQIDLYERWERQNRVRLIKSVNDLEHHLELWQADRKLGSKVRHIKYFQQMHGFGGEPIFV